MIAALRFIAQLAVAPFRGVLMFSQASPDGVTLEQLMALMPKLNRAVAGMYLRPLNEAMLEAGITTKARRAAFLAQLGHESDGLTAWEERAARGRVAGEAYEGRKDLGNTQPGDGPRYKGRGPIQLTGRTNYRAAGAALEVPLEEEPWRAADPHVGFRVAAWYWNSRGLNALADAGTFTEITRRINGGYNGQADREARHRRALALL